MRHQFSYSLLICFLGLFSLPSHAEPWLSNRFAQNCTACHAPGRVNLEAPQRRCTLSCQGCHVNPNGGGLRNEYGKWNQQRWLNSLQASDSWRLQKDRPLPYAQQDYADQNLKAYLEKHAKDSQEKVELTKEILKEGIPLKTTATQISEKYFDRKQGAFENNIEPNRSRFMARIPYEDPLRVKEREPVIAGGDLRYFTINNDENGTRTSLSAPMAADIGVAVRPIGKLSFVTEARFGSYKPKWDQLWTSSTFVRSAYLMLDDLPYNTFIMSGIYRPMFGNYNSDHNSLSSMITGFGYDSKYVATTLGTAPNVPFLNIHAIQHMANKTDEESVSSGYAANLGLRFVTMGASVTISHWATKAVDRNTNEGNGGRTMTSFAIGGTLKDWITNADMTLYNFKTATSSDSGSFLAWENRYRIYRENYLQANYASANTAVGWCRATECLGPMKPGSGNEWGIGFRSFLVSGVDFEIMYINRNETAKDQNSGETTYTFNEKVTQSQVHFYF